jgi:DegV family protein with EDD domain
MDRRIAILTDTTSGISPQLQVERGIYTVPMPIVIDHRTYYEGVTISRAQFFARQRGGVEITTSQPTPGRLRAMWDALLATHETLLYLPMSSGLSGSFTTAQLLAEDYGGRVRVVDNRRISVTLRQSALEAAQMVRQGAALEDIAAYLERDALNAGIYIAVNTLERLMHGGRVTAAGLAIGSVLGIKPVLQIQGGKLDAYQRAWGMDAAMEVIVQALRRDREERFAGQRVAIRAAYTGGESLGESWRRTLQSAFPDLSVGKDPLSLSVACHTGENALGVGIMRDIL